jgi:hypothetical protein
MTEGIKKKKKKKKKKGARGHIYLNKMQYSECKIVHNHQEVLCTYHGYPLLTYNNLYLILVIN